MGWLEYGEERFFLDDTGAVVTGWLDLEDGRYYMDSAGSMKTGWLKLNDSWYYFDENGVLATDTWVGDSYVDESGVWIPDRTTESEKVPVILPGTEDDCNYIANTNTYKFHYLYMYLHMLQIYSPCSHHMFVLL